MPGVCVTCNMEVPRHTGKHVTHAEQSAPPAGQRSGTLHFPAGLKDFVMEGIKLLRGASLSVLVLCGLSACATYDDSAMYGHCTEPAHVKDLPPQVARRESRCDRLEWNTGKDGMDAPLDFSGSRKND